MANRTRNIQLKICLNEEEKQIFEKKMKLTRCKTMSHFISKSVLEGDIFVVDLQELLYATNNINQIAKRVNTTAVIYKHDIQTMKEKIDSLSKEIWQIHSLLLSRTHKAGEKQNGSH